MGSEQPWRKPCFLKCSTMKIHVSSQLLLLPCIARLAKLQNIRSRQSILKCQCWRIFSGRACWAGLRMWTIFIFFSSPSGLILNHGYSFLQFTQYLHKCCCQHREGDSSSEERSDCELCRRKGRETLISVAAAACAVLKLLWNCSKVTNCHHHVWMDNLHPAPLYL